MNQFYLHLFQKGRLGSQTTKNRIVMAPMGDNMANADGSVSEQSIAYYSKRARGGVGVIITGVVCVDYPRGKTIACQYRLDGIKYVNGWARLAREVHRYGALLVPQISHVGAAGDIEITEGLPPYQVSDPAGQNEKQLPGSKVDVNYDVSARQFQTITRDELVELEQKYVNAARYAQMAGCDGVEVHCVSYLIGQLTTPSINLRTDEYGGSLENRIRFAVNVIKGIRETCGPDFIIGARMPVHKWETDGLTDDESKQIAATYEAAGCNFLDANNGLPPSVTALIESQRYEQGARVDQAVLIKEAVNIPVFAVGALREPDFCEKVLAEGKADFVMLGRALIADPEWPEKARTGRAGEIRRCISCMHACYGNLAKSQSIQCGLNPEAGYESILNTLVTPVKKQKHIVIVGGGIAGMQAAITACDRGHKVTLLEAADHLGGQLIIASVPPHKHYINWAREWFTSEVCKRDIDLLFNFTADLQSIQLLNPDLVLVATGSLPYNPPIPGIENGVQSWDLLSGKIEIPNNRKVAVLGGGTVGCETAELLATYGNRVTIIEMLDQIATGLEGANMMDFFEVIKKMEINVLLNSKVTQLEPGLVVTYENRGETKQDTFDYVVLAFGQKSHCEELTRALEDAHIEYRVIGDAAKPSNFQNATSTAYFAALDA